MLAGLGGARDAALGVALLTLEPVLRQLAGSSPHRLHCRCPLRCCCRSHPYPAHRCFIRRGHGFTLLARTVAEAEQLLEGLLLPVLQA